MEKQKTFSIDFSMLMILQTGCGLQGKHQNSLYQVYGGCASRQRLEGSSVTVSHAHLCRQSSQYPKKVHSSTKVSFFQGIGLFQHSTVLDSIEACHNQYVDPKELQETVFEQIESYNEEQAAVFTYFAFIEWILQLPTRPYVTDDGWTVVPKRSTTDEDSMTTKQYKKKKTKELQNFYRYCHFSSSSRDLDQQIPDS